MCGREAETEQQPLTDGVTVFCCDRCATGVLRTFAFHEDNDEPARRRPAS